MSHAESTLTDDDFTSILILNYALLSSMDTRPVFIQQLQHALSAHKIAMTAAFLDTENGRLYDCVFSPADLWLVPPEADATKPA